MAESYEIEIKSLLGSRQNMDRLVSVMQGKDPKFEHRGSHNQLNHYFIGGDLQLLANNVGQYLSLGQKETLASIITRAVDFSLRTRQANDKVILVLKVVIDDTTSANGTARIEFEADMPLALEQLDELVLQAGFDYQAKWSRERNDYKYKGVNVSIDKNAGYGYLAEFEIVEEEPLLADTTKQKLREIMEELEVEELPQDRLARMFEYYNANWRDYYGTEKIFNIE
jgi:adenylate cyclase class IV